jgi:hypothetical protein
MENDTGWEECAFCGYDTMTERLKYVKQYSFTSGEMQTLPCCDDCFREYEFGGGDLAAL